MVKQLLPQKYLKTLNQTLIQPHMDYVLWGGTHETHLNKLTILQKKIIRNITNFKYKEHNYPLFYGFKSIKT